MAKKKKNRRPVQKTKTPEQILQDAEKEFSHKNYIRAREGYKRLHKLDPASHKDRFIEVTTLAIEDLLTMGKEEIAQQWLTHMREDLGMSAEELKASTLLLAVHLGDYSAVADLATAQLKSDSEKERQDGADALVMSESPEAAPILTAIDHLCKQEWEEVMPALKEVSRRSPFSHWKLFIKGCLAYYQGNHADAQKCFTLLPEGSRPATKALAYGNWRRNHSIPLTEQDLTEALHLDKSSEIAQHLEKADQLWDKRDYLKALSLLLLAKSSFPSYEVNLAGHLTRQFRLLGVNLSFREKEKWFSGISQKIKTKRFTTPSSKLFFSHCLIHRIATFDPQQQWKNYTTLREAHLGKNDRFRALCEFGQGMKEYELDCPCEECREGAHQFSRDYFISAISEDPTFFPAYEQLLEIYKDTNEKSQKNELLDVMVDQFPDSEKVLYEAGVECIERESYVKGIKYLEKAYSLSPLKREIRDALLSALEKKAHAHYKKGKAPDWQKGRDSFQKMLDLSEGSFISEFSLEKTALVKWAMVERVHVDEKLSKETELLEKAGEIEPHLYECMKLIYEVDVRVKNKASLEMYYVDFSKLKGGNTSTQALSIIRYINECYMPHNKNFIRGISNGINQYLSGAIKKVKKADRSIITELYDALSNHYTLWQSSLELLVTKALKLDKNDPLYLVWKLQINEKRPTAAEEDKIRKHAEARKDKKALALLERHLDSLEPVLGIGHFSAEEEPDDEGFPFGAEDSDEELLSGMIEMLEMLPKKERIKFLQKSGMSKEEAQTMSELVEFKKKTGSLPPPPAPNSLPPPHTTPNKEKITFPDFTRPKKPRPTDLEIDEQKGQQQFPF